MKFRHRRGLHRENKQRTYLPLAFSYKILSKALSLARARVPLLIYGVGGTRVLRSVSVYIPTAKNTRGQIFLFLFSFFFCSFGARVIQRAATLFLFIKRAVAAAVDRKFYCSFTRAAARLCKTLVETSGGNNYRPIGRRNITVGSGQWRKKIKECRAAPFCCRSNGLDNNRAALLC